MKIVLTGGGTGGHLVPLVTVAKKIKAKIPEAQFLFIGPGGAMEKKIMGGANIPTKSILTGKIRRYFSFRNFIDFFKIPLGVIQCLVILLIHMPDAIFSKGGYASFPVVIVGWMYRIPILIHESDANPGMANSMLSKFAQRVAIAYQEAEKYFPASQVVLSGNPVREDIREGSAERARQAYGFIESKKVIFVVGGSQGARIINNKILNILPDLLRKYQIIHQTGEAHFEEVTKKAGELGIKPGHGGYYPVAFYGEELKDILAVANLVISRASANTISEIAACGKPSILIPLESSANNHQRMNAYSLSKTGACLVLEENNLGENMLLTKIEELMDDEELRAKMSKNIQVFYHPDAAEQIAEGVLGMI